MLYESTFGRFLHAVMEDSLYILVADIVCFFFLLF